MSQRPARKPREHAGVSTVAKLVTIMVGCAIVALSACGGQAGKQAAVITKSGRVVEIDSRSLGFEGDWLIARTKDGERFAIQRSEVESIMGLDIRAPLAFARKQDPVAITHAEPK